MPAHATPEPSDEVLKLPFGPLLDHMMRHAIGLPNHLGAARWTTGKLIDAIGLGIAEVTVTSWKSGLGFPEGGKWTRLRKALTDKIEPGPQEMWQACLDAAWKAASKLNAEGRKALYAPYRPKKGAAPPELDEAPAQEAAALKADIAGLHNRDPDLFSGLHAAFRAQEAGDYPKAEAILFPIVVGGRSKAEEAKEMLARHFNALRALALNLGFQGRYREAIATYAEARDNIPPGQAAAEMEVTRALWATVGKELVRLDDFDAGWDWLEEVEKAHGTASVLAYTVLLNQADEADQGDRVIARMIEAGVQPNLWTWNSRLKLADTIPEGEAVMARMGQAEPVVEPDVWTWTTLLGLARTRAQAAPIFDRMKATGVSPNVVTWTTWMKLSLDLQEGEAILAQMALAEPRVEPNTWTWNVLLGLASTLADAGPILDRMTSAGVKPSAVTWNTMIKLAQSLEEGEAILAQMAQAEPRVEPSEWTWNILLGLAKTVAEGGPILDRMKAAGVTPTVVTWNRLLNLAESLAEGDEVLGRMGRAEPRVAPDVWTWSTLMKLARSLEDGDQILARMRQADPPVAPNERTYSAMAALVRTKAEADRLLGTHFPPFKALSPVFATLIGRIHAEFTGEGLLDWCFTWVEGRSEQGRKVYFPIAAFEPAIVGYRKGKRFDDALRVILPFPHLPAATAFFRESTHRQTLARSYFERELTGDEPHHAAYALFKLEAVTGDRKEQMRWARDALGRENQPQKRLEELQAFLAGA